MSTSAEKVAEFVYAKADARRSATLVQVLALAGALACASLAALLQGPINTQRKQLQLVQQSSVYTDLPPVYAWVSAAGGFVRSVASNLLWIKAENLKQEGKYYASHQYAKWICTLQPRFAQVWSFQSWNMAYNISVGTHTARERWQWVYNGIRLLRDEGIPNNQKVVELYHQLAWTYFHKVGDRMDDFHMAYKRIWATTMEVLLGSPPVTLSDEEQVNYLQPVADAPLTLDALLAKRPSVAKLVDQLKAIDIDVDADTTSANLFHPLELKFFKPYTAWLMHASEAAYQKKPADPDAATAKLWAFLEAAPKEDLDALIAYMRSEVLREQYKMDPKFMQSLTGTFGTDKPVPIDWRTPWAHAIYWGAYGTTRGRELKNIKEFDLLNTDRIVVFSLGALARQGHLILRPNLESYQDSFLDLSPDWRYIEAMHRKCLQLGPIYAEKGEEVYNTAGEAFRDFHVNTLQAAILNLYLAGQEKQADKYFDYLKENYRDRNTNEINPTYQQPFHDFIQQEIRDICQSEHEALWMMHSLMMAGYIGLGNGQYDVYAAKFGKAKELYGNYQKDVEDDRQGRRTFPPFNQMQADALGAFVTNPVLPLVLRFTVWNRVAATAGYVEEIKQRCYDDVRRVLAKDPRVAEYDLDKAFPPPPGMAEWHNSHPVLSPEQVAKRAAERKKAEDAKAAHGGQ